MQNTRRNLQRQRHDLRFNARKVSGALSTKLFTAAKNAVSLDRDPLFQLLLPLATGLSPGLAPRRFNLQRNLLRLRLHVDRGHLLLQPKLHLIRLRPCLHRHNHLDDSLPHRLKLQPRYDLPVPRLPLPQPHGQIRNRRTPCTCQLKRRCHRPPPSSASSCPHSPTGAPTPTTPAVPCLHPSCAPAPSPPCLPSSSRRRVSSSP